MRTHACMPRAADTCLFPRPLQGGGLELEAPFRGCSVFVVSLFVRLLYSQAWRQAPASALGSVHDSLPALLRLSHQLDAADLLAPLCSYMAGARLAGEVLEHAAHMACS